MEDGLLEAKVNLVEANQAMPVEEPGAAHLKQAVGAIKEETEGTGEAVEEVTEEAMEAIEEVTGEAV